MAVRVSVDLRELRALPRRVNTVVEALARSRVRREVADQALSQHRERYGRREAPDGRAWPPRKPPTGSHPLLQETGRMRRSLRATPEAAGVAVSATRPVDGVDVAAVHQYGSERIPARTFLGFSGDDVDELAGTAEHWLGRFVGEVLR